MTDQLPDNPIFPEAPAPRRAEPPRPSIRPGLLARLRGYFFAGVLITAPMGITFYLAWLFVSFVDNRVRPLIPARYLPEDYLPFGIPGMGLVIVIVGLTIIGMLTAGYVGRSILRFSERVLARMPVIRSVYGGVKQIFETVLANRNSVMREVVLIEFPRPGMWALGFVTGTTAAEVQASISEDVLNVFVPKVPNPTTGFLLFIPRSRVMSLAMSVEDGLKMVVSGGIVTPPDRRAAGQRPHAPATPVRAPLDPVDTAPLL